MRRIQAYRPNRGAVKLTAKHAFNYAIAYGDAWQQYCEANPLNKICEDCGANNNTVRHHEIPISKGGQHLRSQIGELCKKCHVKRHPHLQKHRIKKIRR